MISVYATEVDRLFCHHSTTVLFSESSTLFDVIYTPLLFDVSSLQLQIASFLIWRESSLQLQIASFLFNNMKRDLSLAPCGCRG
jgi:hypothetical protein